MDDLIYILVLVAWVVYSIYNARQKKKLKELREKPVHQSGQEYEPVETQQPRRSIFEEIFQETGYEEFHEEEPEEKAMPVFGEIPKQQHYFTYEEPDVVFEKEEELYTGAIQTVDEDGVVDKDAILTEKPVIHSNVFDLRKAVIYSAILERPHH